MAVKSKSEWLAPADVFVGRLMKSGRPLYEWAREVGLEPYRFSKALHGARPLQPRDRAALVKIGGKLGLAAHEVFEGKQVESPRCRS